MYQFREGFFKIIEVWPPVLRGHQEDFAVYLKLFGSIGLYDFGQLLLKESFQQTRRLNKYPNRFLTSRTPFLVDSGLTN